MSQTEFRKKVLSYLGKVLAMCVIALPLGFLVSNIVYKFGLTHSLSAFAIGSFFCLFFIALDNWLSTSISKLQWTALAINVALLTYTFLLLPTQDAIVVLNNTDVEQNFLSALKKWWFNT